MSGKEEQEGGQGSGSQDQQEEITIESLQAQLKQKDTIIGDLRKENGSKRVSAKQAEDKALTIEQQFKELKNQFEEQNKTLFKKEVAHALTKAGCNDAELLVDKYDKEKDGDLSKWIESQKKGRAYLFETKEPTKKNNYKPTQRADGKATFANAFNDAFRQN